MLRKLPLTAAALSISLLLASAPHTLAASNTNKKTTNSATKTTVKTTKKEVVHTLANLNAVKITAKSTVRLTDINILTQDEESILTYTLTIKNGDNKTLDLLDYWSKVKTTSGTSYSTTLMTKDKDKKKLSAGSSTTLTYVVKVAKNTKISNLVFQVVKWDFSQPGYEALKGQFKVPATYLTSTPANQSKSLRISDIPVKGMVKQVATYASGDYNYVSVTLNVQNIGYRIFEDPKIKFVIKASNGASYPMSADSTSVGYRIQPQDTKTLNLMTAIPKSIKLTNMELQWVQDDETAKMSLPISTMQLPEISDDKLLTTDPNVEKTIPLGSGKISASISGVTMSPSFDEHNLSVRVLLRNTSGTTVTLPKYQFEVQTKDGYRLPITTGALENVIMQPLEERVFSVAVTIPATVKTEDPKLFMNLPAGSEGTDEFKYPVAIFNLPESQSVENMIGQKQFMQTGKGIIGFELASLQRLPWSDGDLVSARIRIINPSAKTIMLPELLGQLQIDSAKLKANTKIITSQNAGLLGATSSTDVYIVSKIPSNLDFSQVNVSLMEKVGESSNEWMQFGYVGALPELQAIQRGANYEINTSGKSQSLKVLRSYVYTGTSSDLVYAELEVQNMEDNQIDLSQFIGSFKASGGQSYKASVSQIETSAGPEEKSIVALWAKIPKKVPTSDMKLVIGEGITEDKFTPIKGEPTGYVNAASMELGITQPDVRNSLSDLNLFPYSLSVNNVRATLSGGTSVSVTFSYSQKRNMDYAIGEFGHKYLFEVVDASGRTFEKEFVPETDFKITSGGSASFNFDDAAFEKRIVGNFKLNVYDSFQGQKVLIGSQGFNYITSIPDEGFE